MVVIVGGVVVVVARRVSCKIASLIRNKGYVGRNFMFASSW